MVVLSSALAFQIIWQSRASLPDPRAALLHAAVNGRLLAAGGTHWKDERKLWSTRCDFFDPQTNAWLPGPPLPMPRADSPSLEVKGEFLFFGGTSEGRVLDDVLAFDGKQWKDRPEMRLPAPRSYSQVALVGQRIYVFGGLEKAGDIKTATRDIWMWNLDEADAGWHRISQMPEPARSNYAFAVIDGKAYLFGGVTPTKDGFRNLSECWSYDFARNAWSSLPNVPEATRAWAATVWNGSIFILGGYTNDFARAILQFSPNSGEMTYVGDLPRGLADVRFVVIDNSLYVTGGESGNKVRSGETWQGVQK
jgi:N-acetylneuraminic acid mutarotase